jgi:septum formation protein
METMPQPTALPLILASTSPYRKSLLAKLGLAFEVVAPHVDETAQDRESPEQLVARLAEAKAKAVARNFPAALIIGSDQVAVVDGQIVGKPHTHEKAAMQLKRAAGKRIAFLTGVCLYNSKSGRSQTDVVPFYVVLRPLTDLQIQHYLQQEQPYDCAGGFKAEGLGIALFERLEGTDPNTLIGLPLIRLIQMLENEGVCVI